MHTPSIKLETRWVGDVVVKYFQVGGCYLCRQCQICYLRAIYLRILLPNGPDYSGPLYTQAQGNYWHSAIYRSLRSPSQLFYAEFMGKCIFVDSFNPLLGYLATLLSDGRPQFMPNFPPLLMAYTLVSNVIDFPRFSFGSTSLSANPIELMNNGGLQ